jgi:hypothetical protein
MNEEDGLGLSVFREHAMPVGRPNLSVIPTKRCVESSSTDDGRAGQRRLGRIDTSDARRARCLCLSQFSNILPASRIVLVVVHVVEDK